MPYRFLLLRLPRRLLRRLSRRTMNTRGQARNAGARTRRRISAGGRESRVLGRALRPTGEAGLTNRDGRSLTAVLPLFRTRLHLQPLWLRGVDDFSYRNV